MEITIKDLILDPEDAERFKYCTFQVKIGNAGHKSVIFSSGEYRLQTVGRVLLNCPEDLEVDHRNHNGLDCRKENLRLATRQQQNQNRRGWTIKKSGLPKGVYKNGKGFIARLKHNGSDLNLGTYSTPEQAKEVWNTKAKELHGDFYCP